MVWDGGRQPGVGHRPRRAGAPSPPTTATPPPRAHASSRPTESYGPAPVSDLLQRRHPHLSHHHAPRPDRLRQRHRAHDSTTGPWTGLAATYWDNRTAGRRTPSVDEARDGPTGPRPGRPQPRQPPARPQPARAGLPPGLSANNWSARYTGELTVTTAGAHGFALSLTGGGQLFVDDVLVIDATGNRSTTTVVNSPALGVAERRSPPHPARLRAPTAGTATLALRWTPAATSSSGAVPATSVAPRYSMATASHRRRPAHGRRHPGVGHDLRFDPATPVIPKATGLATSSTADLGGTDPVKHRWTTSTPPACSGPAPATSPARLGAAQRHRLHLVGRRPTPLRGTCAGADDVIQAGALRTLTQPDQGGGARREESYVYDWAGRGHRAHHRRRPAPASPTTAGAGC